MQKTPNRNLPAEIRYRENLKLENGQNKNEKIS